MTFCFDESALYAITMETKNAIATTRFMNLKGTPLWGSMRYILYTG